MKGFLGILGGMGPLASANFLRIIVNNTEALIDQDHIPVIYYGDTMTPDRTTSIINGSDSTLQNLLQGIEFLNRAEVGVICIACNCAHYWYDEMQKKSVAPILHIVKASVDQIKIKNKHAKAIGIISTYGTYKSRIYSDYLEGAGYEVVMPGISEFELLVSPAIALVKANKISEAQSIFQEISSRLFSRGAEVIVFGCTEIIVAMNEQYEKNPSLFVDSTESLAISAINFYKNKN